MQFSILIGSKNEQKKQSKQCCLVLATPQEWDGPPRIFSSDVEADEAAHHKEAKKFQYSHNTAFWGEHSDSQVEPTGLGCREGTAGGL